MKAQHAPTCFLRWVAMGRTYLGEPRERREASAGKAPEGTAYDGGNCNSWHIGFDFVCPRLWPFVLGLFRVCTPVCVAAGTWVRVQCLL